MMQYQNENEMIMICPYHNIKYVQINQDNKYVCQLCIQQPYGEGNLNNNIKKIKNFRKGLRIIIYDYYYNKLIQQLNQSDLTGLDFQDEQQEVQNINYNEQTDQEQQNNNIKYEYKLLPESIIKQSFTCYDIAFNKDASIVVAGCMYDIKVFEFKDNKLLQLQQLEGHQHFIKCLQFMKKSDQFISVQRDGLIKIWSQNNNKEWINTQTLVGHLDWTRFLIINQKEDLIIQGVDDLIQFWSFNNKNEWSIYQTMEFEDVGSYASLNDSNTKLIFFENCFIQILERQENEWIVTQQIQGEHDASKLLFISDYEFVVQPFLCKSLQFYTLNKVNNLYEIGYEVEVSLSQYSDHAGFPINFIKSKQLLIAKNGNYVNILRKQGNGLFFLEYSFEFYESDFIGRVSDDGKFLIFWDSHNEEFQVRMFKDIY